jgi:hypothetical protein
VEARVIAPRGNSQARVRVRAVELSEANAFVAQHHRHHKPVVGHRFSLGAFDGDRLCGVVIVGRPVLGYERIQTFILDSEPGTSLRASGWEREAVSPGGQWNHPDEPYLFDGPNRRTDQPTCAKVRWARRLAS